MVANSDALFGAAVTDIKKYWQVHQAITDRSDVEIYRAHEPT